MSTQPFLRLAHSGDLCILLLPSAEEEETVHRRQKQLQMTFGGRAVEDVHLTLQRFTTADEESTQQVWERLCVQFKDRTAIALMASSLVIWPSPYDGEHMLRWRVELNLELRRLAASVEGVLLAMGATPLYLAGWQPNLVTALSGINKHPLDHQTLELLPSLLFTIRRIALSKIKEIGEYEIIANYRLGSSGS